MPLQYFRIKIVSLGHIQMRHYILIRLILQHVVIENNIVKVLIVLFVLEVVHNCQLRWVVFQQDLYRHRWH